MGERHQQTSDPIPGRVVRGLLIRLLQAFAVPDQTVWYRTYLPLLVLVVVALVGAAAWTIGTDWAVRWANENLGRTPGKTVEGGVHAAVVVASISFLAFLLTLLNTIVTPLQQKPFVFVVPERLYSWLAGMASFGVGLLIGISIFR